MNTQAQNIAPTSAEIIAFPGEKKDTFLGLQTETWYDAGKLAGAAAVGAGALYGYQWLTSPSEDDEAAAAAAAKAEFDRLHAAIKESGDTLSNQIGNLASRLDAMDGRLGKVEGAVGNLHHRLQALENAKPAAPAFDVGQLMAALPATVAGIAEAVQEVIQAPVAETPAPAAPVSAAPVAETSAPAPAAPVAAAPAVETLHRPQPAAVKPQGKR